MEQHVVDVILDTDIGDNIDDTWALALLMRSPELRLRYVLTAGPGHHRDRAKLLSRVLAVDSTSHVPIGLGCNSGAHQPLAQAAAVAGFEMPATQAVHEDGVGALIDLVMSEATAERPMTLLAIAPLDNVAEALRREPAIAPRLMFVGMHGSVYRGYGKKVVPEYNVLRNVPACQATFDAPFARKVITPLDTCGAVTLGTVHAQTPGQAQHKARKVESQDPHYDALLASDAPLVRELLRQYSVWYDALGDNMAQMTHGPYNPTRSSTLLFDTVAVWLAFSFDTLVVQRMYITVDDEGFTRPHGGGDNLPAHTNAMDVAVEWRDLDAFKASLVERLIGWKPKNCNS